VIRRLTRIVHTTTAIERPISPNIVTHCYCRTLKLSTITKLFRSNHAGQADATLSGSQYTRKRLRRRVTNTASRRFARHETKGRRNP
jgi:hypothetical protein